MRQCSARERMRASTSSRFASVPSAKRVANSRASGSISPSANSDQKPRASSSPHVPETSAAKSICKAHSRALRREPIIQLRPTTRDPDRSGFCTKSFPIKINQFYRCRGRFETLVAQLNPGAIVCLILILRRNDAKQQRHSGLQARGADAARGFSGDVFKVRRLSANDHAQTNHRVELARLGRLQSAQRNFKRARHAKNLDRVLVCRKFRERNPRASDQTRHERIVPAAGDNRKAKSSGDERRLIRTRL